MTEALSRLAADRLEAHGAHENATSALGELPPSLETETRLAAVRAEIDLVSIVQDIPPAYQSFYSNTELHKCSNCGAVHPGKQPPTGWVKL